MRSISNQRRLKPFWDKKQDFHQEPQKAETQTPLSISDSPISCYCCLDSLNFANVNYVYHKNTAHGFSFLSRNLFIIPPLNNVFPKSLAQYVVLHLISGFVLQLRRTVTGSSTGFGRGIAEFALKNGDKVRPSALVHLRYSIASNRSSRHYVNPRCLTILLRSTARSSS